MKLSHITEAARVEAGDGDTLVEPVAEGVPADAELLRRQRRGKIHVQERGQRRGFGTALARQTSYGYDAAW